jgi:hypothetical protein
MKPTDQYLQGLYRLVWWWKDFRTAVHDPSLQQYGMQFDDCAYLYINDAGNITLRSMIVSSGGENTRRKRKEEEEEEEGGGGGGC